MRLVGTTVCGLLFAAVTLAQQPAGPAPGAPGTPPGTPPAAPPADPRLETHLAGWEKAMGQVSNFHAAFELTRTANNAFKKERKYTGSVLCMKPNLARLRIDSTTDKNDYQAYICNGKSIYEYSGLEKTITEFKLSPSAAAAGGDNLMLDFLGGMKAAAAKQRFQIALFKEDPKQLYVYLDIKPTLGKDKQEFEHVRFALFGPGAPEQLRYLPAQVWLQKPNGDQELWAFAKQQTNVPGVTAKAFDFVNVPGWAVKQAPAGPLPAPGAPPMPPGGTNLPAGPGAVKK